MNGAHRKWLGVTGHRPNKLAADRLPRIRAQCAEVLDAIAATAAPIGIVSALAEGADRLLAQLGVARGLELHCILPFAATEYERDFADVESRREFRALLARSGHIDELPGNPAERAAAYEAAGRAMLDHCDVLIAIWDGLPATGRGGSAQIVAEAVARAIPVIWIHSLLDRPPVLRRDGDVPFVASTLPI